MALWKVDCVWFMWHEYLLYGCFWRHLGYNLAAETLVPYNMIKTCKSRWELIFASLIKSGSRQKNCFFCFSSILLPTKQTIVYACSPGFTFRVDIWGIADWCGLLSPNLFDSDIVSSAKFYGFISIFMLLELILAVCLCTEHASWSGLFFLL